MVKLTVDGIARGTSSYTKKKRDETMSHYLRRLTHLYLERRHINEITEDLSLCHHLTVLYLYDNELTAVPNLTYNHNLTHLYLQNNCIGKLENIGALRKLTKLYVGYNSITVVEGLNKLPDLQELHIEHQRLPLGEKLLFDPRSLENMAGSLQVLNVSGNHLDSLTELCTLSKLMQLMAADNRIADHKQMADSLRKWRDLLQLELNGNPVCHRAKYRDRVLIACPTLRMLDGKEVTETAKQFLRNWQANKEAISRKLSSMSVGMLPASLLLPPKPLRDTLLRSESYPQTNGISINGHRTGASFIELSPTKHVSERRPTCHQGFVGSMYNTSGGKQHRGAIKVIINTRGTQSAHVVNNGSTHS